MSSAIECVKRVVECDNGRDEAGYRALLHDDYRSYVHGKEQNVGADVEAAALAEWWKAASDVHLEIVEMTEQGGLVQVCNTMEPGEFRIGRVGKEFPDQAEVKLINKDEVDCRIDQFDLCICS